MSDVISVDNVGIVTVGDTRRQIVVYVVDENNQVVSLNTTAANHRLQGRSKDLTSKTIDVVASAVDGPAGKITFNTVGGLVTAGDLSGGGVKSATFFLACKFTDIGALIGFTEKFTYIWDRDPTVAPP